MKQKLINNTNNLKKKFRNNFTKNELGGKILHTCKRKKLMRM